MTLYDDLGVPKDASEKAIRSFYRRKAKRAHPDARGGSREAFERLTTALAVLTDPAQRHHYDKTGEFGRKPADNPLRRMIGAVVGMIEAIAKGNQGLKLTHIDLRNAIEQYAKGGQEDLREQIASAEKKIAMWHSLAGRMAVPEGVPNLFEIAVNERIGEAEVAIHHLRGEIEALDQLIVLMKDAVFTRELDPPATGWGALRVDPR